MQSLLISRAAALKFSRKPLKWKGISQVIVSLVKRDKKREQKEWPSLFNPGLTWAARQSYRKEQTAIFSLMQRHINILSCLYFYAGANLIARDTEAALCPWLITIKGFFF